MSGADGLDQLIRSDGSLPLRIDEGGVVRVGTGRITLDLIVEQLENGMSAEGIADAYDGLSPDEAATAIAFYDHHRDDVRAYLTRRKAEAEATEKAIVSGGHRIGRQELAARRNAAEASRAAVGN